MEKIYMYKIASLFTGIGGLEYGFTKDENFDIVFANDFDHWACETYRCNHVNAESYLKEGDIKDYINNIPDHDILLGGFPCQPFTLAGHRKGFDDNRGLEFFNCVKALTLYKPKFFYFENVKGILSHDKGKTLSRVLEELNNCGYKVENKLVRMSNYGVSQHRERVIFIGVRNDLPYKPIDLYPSQCGGAKSLRELLKDFPPLSDTQTSDLINHNYHYGTSRKMHWIKLLKEGENLYHLEEDEIRHRERELNLEPAVIPKSIMGYRRLDGNQISPTMMFGNTCLPIHFEEDRSISVREAAYVQSFPLDFEFKGGISYQYKQVGNAVPPVFGSLLAEQFKKIVL